MLRIVPVNKSLLCPISTGLQFHHFNSISLSPESLLNNYIWEITFLSVTVNCPCYCSFEVLALVWNSGPLTPTSKRSFCRKPMGAHCHLMVNYRRSTSALLQYTLQPWRIKKLQVWNQIANKVLHFANSTCSCWDCGTVIYITQNNKNVWHIINVVISQQLAVSLTNLNNVF